MPRASNGGAGGKRARMALWCAPRRITMDVYSAEQAKKEGGIEVEVSMFVRQPNSEVGSSSRGAAVALTSGDENAGDAPVVGAVLPLFAHTPAAAGVVAMTASEALARAVEYGFEYGFQ